MLHDLGTEKIDNLYVAERLGLFPICYASEGLIERAKFVSLHTHLVAQVHSASTSFHWIRLDLVDLVGQFSNCLVEAMLAFISGNSFLREINELMELLQSHPAAFQCIHARYE